MEEKKLAPNDYSSEISMELTQLVALGEMLRLIPDPDEIRKGFFLGLGEMISAMSDRIRGMVGPTYEECYRRGQDSTTRSRAVKAV